MSPAHLGSKLGKGWTAGITLATLRHTLMSKALTNDYGDCRLINLGSDENGGGPFIIAQKAYDPKDEQSIESVFLLRPTGVWINELAQEGLTEERRLEILFGSVAEAVKLLESLSSTVQIERHEVTEQDLRNRVAALQGGGYERRLQRMAEEYRELHSKR